VRDVDGTRALLRSRGLAPGLVAKAHNLNPLHFKNALDGRSPFSVEELVALTGATGLPCTECVDPTALERALR